VFKVGDLARVRKGTGIARRWEGSVVQIVSTVEFFWPIKGIVVVGNEELIEGTEGVFYEKELELL